MSKTKYNFNTLLIIVFYCMLKYSCTLLFQYSIDTGKIFPIPGLLYYILLNNYRMALSFLLFRFILISSNLTK